VKVIVTGASGFVGHRVVKELLRRGVKTCAVARHPVEFPDSVVVDNYFDTPSGDVLIHLAENPNRAQVNEIGSAYLCEAGALANSLVSKGYQRIVFASSAVVYGDKDKRRHKPMDPVLATDVYSQSKLECEMLFDKNNGVIARISNLYGVGMSTENVFSKIIQQVRCAGEVKVCNDKPIRDFLWVDDAVDALVEMALGRAKGIYNVASGRAVSIGELIDAALLSSGVDKQYTRTLTKSADAYSAIFLDISDTFDSFGWAPKMKLEDGIKRLLNNEMRIQ
jgi:UDP-glucose 4-epimerase